MIPSRYTTVVHFQISGAYSFPGSWHTGWAGIILSWTNSISGLNKLSKVTPTTHTMVFWLGKSGWILWGSVTHSYVSTVRIFQNGKARESKIESSRPIHLFNKCLLRACYVPDPLLVARGMVSAISTWSLPSWSLYFNKGKGNTCISCRWQTCSPCAFVFIVHF